MKKIILHALILLSFIGFKLKYYGYKIELYFKNKSLNYAIKSGQIPIEPEVNNPNNPQN